MIAAEVSSEEVKDTFQEEVKNLGNLFRCSGAHLECQLLRGRGMTLRPVCAAQ